MWSLINFSRIFALIALVGVAVIALSGAGAQPMAAGQSTGTYAPYLPLRLAYGGEYASRNSYALNGGGQITTTTDHCLELVWQYVSSPQTNPYGSTSTTGTTGTTGTTTGTSTAGQQLAVTRAVGMSTPVSSTTSTGVVSTSTSTTATTSTSTTSTGTTSTSTTSGGPCSAYTYTRTSNYLYVYVDQPSGGPSVGLGTNPGTTFGSGPGTSPLAVHLDGAAQLLYLVNPGTNVAIEWHATGPLTGGTFVFHKYAVAVTYGSNDNTNWYLCYNSAVDTPYTITISKQACQVSSIDSRNAYSDADTPPTDANKSSRKLNFSTDIFKGGVFVGNMSATNTEGDRSGTARTQIYPGLSSSAYSLMIVSLLHTGSPSYATGDMPVGVYCPSTSDPNLPGASGAPSVSTVTWTTQWSINPRTTPGTPPDFTQDPVSTTTLLGSGSTNSGSAIGDYASFLMTQVYDQAYTQNGNTYYQTLAVNPATAGQAICLAAYNEASYITNNTTLFHWLMNPNYPTTGLAFPYTDAQPRLWLISGAGVN